MMHHPAYSHKYLQLPELDMDDYTSTPDPNFELLLKDATFRWAKMLSKEERNKLHAKKKKHKGKSKMLLASDDSDKQLEKIAEEEQSTNRVFRLSKINLSIKKVPKQMNKLFLFLVNFKLFS